MGSAILSRPPELGVLHSQGAKGEPDWTADLGLGKWLCDAHPEEAGRRRRMPRASIIGIYEGQLLGAEEGHRGHALGAAMAIAGAAYRVLTAMWALATHGEQALRRARRIVNGQEMPSPLPLETRPRRFWARAADADGEFWSVESDDSYEARAKLTHLPRVIAGERKWADLRLS